MEYHLDRNKGVFFAFCRGIMDLTSKIDISPLGRGAPYNMVKKTGIPTVIKVARSFCRTLDVLAPLIIRATDEDPTVVSALNVAHTACEALEQVLKEFVEVGD